MKQRGKKLLGMLVLAFTLAIIGGFNGATASAETVVPKEVVTIKDIITDENTYTYLAVQLGADVSATDVKEIQIQHDGVMELAYAASGLNANVNIDLYSDAACTKNVGYTAYMSSASLSGLEEYKVSKGTYYLKTSYASYAEPTAENEIVFIVRGYSAIAKNVNGNGCVTYTKDYDRTVYHKLKVAHTGMVSIGGFYTSGSGYVSGLSIQLLNSKKVQMTRLYTSENEKYTESVVLKKGTYYLAVKEGYKYVLTANNSSKVKDDSAASKNKAKLIKSGKKVNTYFTVSDSTSKAKWFKIKLNKTTKLKFDVSVATSGNNDIKVEVIPADSRQIIFNSTQYVNSKGSKIISKGKFKPGTYYICVTKYCANDGAVISIKNKTK